MVENKDALIKAPESSIAIPSYIKKGDARGVSHITQDDIQMPRMALAQGLSPQIQKTDPKYIEGLEMGEMFNSLTSEKYGTGPLEFCIVRADPPRGVEFFPLEEGGGVKDLDVPVNDPRMQFGPNSEKPIATKFYDFIIALLPTRELIALSFKGTGIKVAKQLNGLITMRGTALFTGLYELTSAVEKGRLGTYGVYRVRNLGFVDEETATWAEEAYNAIGSKEIVIDRETPQDEGETSSGDAQKKVPF